MSYKKQYKVMVLTWTERGGVDNYSDHLETFAVGLSTLDEAIELAKSAIDMYTNNDKRYEPMFSLSDRHFGTYKKDDYYNADGIRAYVESY